MTSTLQRLTRAPRVWLLWLGLVMLAAHSLATWHPYSHSIAEVAGHAGQQDQMELADCGLCLAGVANLGGAPPMLAAPLLPRLAPHSPPTPRLIPVQLAPARQPYAIRAPPVIAG
ncbi:MAG TPA: hypothetical protein VN649_03400 [Ramlibacter sp.]|nr:hypothetical protein [Ramlibacter sp.]